MYPFEFQHFVKLRFLQYFVEGIQFGGYSRCCKHLAILEPLANIALFVPSGFAITGILSFDHRSVFRRLGFAVAFCLAFSLLIEFLQVFQPARTASLTDVLMNTTGGLVGSLIFVIMKNKYRTLPGEEEG